MRTHKGGISLTLCAILFLVPLVGVLAWNLKLRSERYLYYYSNSGLNDKEQMMWKTAYEMGKEDRTIVIVLVIGMMIWLVLLLGHLLGFRISLHRKNLKVPDDSESRDVTT